MTPSLSETRLELAMRHIFQVHTHISCFKAGNPSACEVLTAERRLKVNSSKVCVLSPLSWNDTSAGIFFLEIVQLSFFRRMNYIVYLSEQQRVVKKGNSVSQLLLGHPGGLVVCSAVSEKKSLRFKSWDLIKCWFLSAKPTKQEKLEVHV